jgi:hypothetical protein
MNGIWKEAETRIVELPEDDPEIFAVYTNYVYTGQLSIADKTKEEISLLVYAEFTTEVSKEYDTIFRLYVLAGKVQDVATKNALMEAAMDATKLRSLEGSWTMPKAAIINLLYKGTPPNCSARRFLTDVWTSMNIAYIFEIITPEPGLRERPR